MELRTAVYRHYPLEVKSAIITSGVTNLFPQMNIPRKTAAYWISKRKQIAKTVDINLVHQDKITFLEHELEKEKSLRLLIEKVHKIFPFDFDSTRVKSKTTKSELVEAIAAATKLHPLKICLESLRITPRIYYRWVSANKKCELTQKSCARKHPNQLSDTEIEKMKRYMTSKKYAHVSIFSMCLLAQRNGDLFCSVDTWYKYKKMFDWVRPNIKRKAKRKDVGIRATMANEIWHVDITHITLGNGTKAYLQTVVDNYSRFLISWKLTQKISSLNTVKNLKEAKENALKEYKQLSTNVMMDGGPENKNHEVLKFIDSSNMKRVIARSDIQFSNSMVEAFFRSLKNNFLYHQKYQTLKDLERKLKFYFKQHNEVMPHSALGGATPREVFIGIWTEEFQAKLANEKQWAFLLRKRNKFVSFCARCDQLPKK